MRIIIIYEVNREAQSLTEFSQGNTLHAINEALDALIDRISIATNGNAEILGIVTEK